MVIAVATAFTLLDADQPGRIGIFRRGADRAAKRKAAQEELQPAENKDCRHHHHDGKLADVDVARQLPGCIGQVADERRERAGVCAELLEQQVVDDDRQAEGRQDRQQRAAAGAALQNEALQQPPGRRHDRQHDQQAGKRRNAGFGGEQPQPVSGCDRQAAMREIDDPHDREHEGQAAGDNGVVAAEQDALEQGVDHDALLSPDVRCNPK